MSDNSLTWASPGDVTDRWIGGEIPASGEQIKTLLLDAEDTILSEFPDLPARVEDPAHPRHVPPFRVARVAARMVIRHLRNPSGVRSTQDGAGPFQQTVTYGGEEPGTLFLTDKERRILTGEQRTGKAYQVDMTPALDPLQPPLPGFQGWVTPSEYVGHS